MPDHVAEERNDHDGDNREDEHDHEAGDQVATNRQHRPSPDRR